MIVTPTQEQTTQQKNQKTNTIASEYQFPPTSSIKLDHNLSTKNHIITHQTAQKQTQPHKSHQITTKWPRRRGKRKKDQGGRRWKKGLRQSEHDGGAVLGGDESAEGAAGLVDLFEVLLVHHHGGRHCRKISPWPARISPGNAGGWDGEDETWGSHASPLMVFLSVRTSVGQISDNIAGQFKDGCGCPTVKTLPN